MSIADFVKEELGRKESKELEEFQKVLDILNPAEDIEVYIVNVDSNY